MISQEAIQKAVERVVSAARPAKVILFGSYARGDEDEGSDLDLMVIESEVLDKHAEIVRLRKAVGSLGAGVDVLVYSEAEVSERKDWCTSPVYWALREGKVLYESSSERKLATPEAKVLFRSGRRGASLQVIFL